MRDKETLHVNLSVVDKETLHVNLSVGKETLHVNLSRQGYGNLSVDKDMEICLERQGYGKFFAYRQGCGKFGIVFSECVIQTKVFEMKCKKFTNYRL